MKFHESQDPPIWNQGNFPKSQFRTRVHAPRARPVTPAVPALLPARPPRGFPPLRGRTSEGSSHGLDGALLSSPAWGTLTDTHSAAHGPWLLIFGKLNKCGELAGDSQRGWGCGDENGVSGVPESPPMCLKQIKRTLDPGYQRVQKDQEALKLMVCQKPPATEGHYFPSLKWPQFWGLIWSLIEMFQTVDYNEDETSPVHFMTFAKKGRLVIR